MVRARTGRYFFGFNPAVSDEAAKRIRREIRSWRLHLRSGSTIGDLARAINPIVRGWINYYGRFYKSELVYVLDGINHYLMRWATRKFKGLRRHRRAPSRYGARACCSTVLRLPAPAGPRCIGVRTWMSRG
jgi:hypothetical protein